jgi:hypothetical protein
MGQSTPVAMVLPVVVLSLALFAAPAAKLSKLEQGTRAFAQGEFEVALKALDAAALEGGEPSVLEKVQLLRAQCFAARQDFSRAEDAFALALEQNPDVALDPARVDPTVVKMLDAVRARLTGTLVLSSSPPGALLFVDGRNAGVTPQTVSVPVGRHKVEARWGEGPLSATEVQLKPRREARVEWVQAPPKEVPVAPAGPTGRPLRPFGEVRGTLEVSSAANVAPAGGLDLGGGFEFSFFRAALSARLYPYFGVVPRAGFWVPLTEKISVQLELEVPLWFRNNAVAVGLGGQAGGEYHFLDWLGGFVQIGGQHLFLNPGHNDSTYFTATLGTRLRMP